MALNTVFDLHKLYKTYFTNSPYFVAGADSKEPVTEVPGYSITSENPHPRGKIAYSSKNIALNKIGAYGQSIWFPVELFKSGQLVIEIDACTIAVNLSKTIIKTAVSERKGTIKECFAIDDYRFTIRGFLIGKDRKVPEDQILQLRDWFETTEPIELHGGYPELFMDESCRVAITTLDFPEVQGKAVWIRPFTMTLETDFIDDLTTIE